MEENTWVHSTYFRDVIIVCPTCTFLLPKIAVRNVVKLREWLKHEFYTLGNETWKGKT